MDVYNYRIPGEPGMTLELKNVGMRVGADMHIYDANMKLEEGAFNILLGTTLSGKTTLMRLMAGLEKPSSGEIWFNDKNVSGVAVQKRNVAFVYQQFINYPNFTVFENIASPLRVLGKNKKQINDAVGKVAELLKLSPMLDRMPDELSGGQQQRTALARALVKEAKLVLLDEPLANLDYKLREELREELPPLFADLGTTVVYATSEPTEALLLGGYTATLHEGRVVEFGSTPDLYHRPSTLTCAQVFSDPPINTMPFTKHDGVIELGNVTRWSADDAFGDLPDGQYTLGVRPHHLNLAPSSGRTLPVQGKVIVTEISGSESVVHAAIGDTAWVSQNHGVHPMSIGQTISFHIQTESCLIFDNNDTLVTAWQK